MHPELPKADDLPEIGQITLRELFAALRRGLDDFRAAPLFGIFFSGVYVVAGLALLALGSGTFTWTLTVSMGFPLVAPFAAVGLYEVSRRLEDGEPLDWRAILGVVLRERHRQMPWIGAIILIYFLIWTLLAHLIFALIMGPSALINITTSLQALMTPRGYLLIAVEMAVGGVLAFVLFSLTVVSLPLLLEREVDFVSAMLLSLRTVRQNPVVMLVWAGVIALLTLVALLPYFMGLLVVLPILGHATWHIYRRAVCFPV